jgi:hypothetical protein
VVELTVLAVILKDISLHQIANLFLLFEELFPILQQLISPLDGAFVGALDLIDEVHLVFQ